MTYFCAGVSKRQPGVSKPVKGVFRAVVMSVRKPKGFTINQRVNLAIRSKVTVNPSKPSKMGLRASLSAMIVLHLVI